jgi:hypothetical protein
MQSYIILGLGRRKGHLFSKEDIENVKSNLISTLDSIINDSSFLPTKNERSCTFCDFAKSGACNTGVFRAKKLAKA